MNSTLAPIVLFVYKRPQHTLQTLEALAQNTLASESILYIYADGAKERSDQDNVNEVRKIIKSGNWCKETHIVESEKNKGLKPSIIQGVTELLEVHEKIIVLEDDLVTTPVFLQFMNDCLETFRKHANIYSVNGYMFPTDTSVCSTVLLPYISTWGWGTWRDKWKYFKPDATQPDAKKIISNKFLQRRFNLADYDYASMLLNSKDSWGIHWYYSIFIRNGLSVFPTRSLVKNIGLDGSGINCDDEDIQHDLANAPFTIKESDEIDLEFLSKYYNYFTDTSKKKKSGPELHINNKTYSLNAKIFLKKLFKLKST